jgi:hypothetical protein
VTIPTFSFADPPDYLPHQCIKVHQNAPFSPAQIPILTPTLPLRDLRGELLPRATGRNKTTHSRKTNPLHNGQRTTDHGQLTRDHAPYAFPATSTPARA